MDEVSPPSRNHARGAGHYPATRIRQITPFGLLRLFFSFIRLSGGNSVVAENRILSFLFPRNVV